MAYADFCSGSLFSEPTTPSQKPRQAKEARLAAMSGSPQDRAEFTRTVIIDVDGYTQGIDFIENLIDRAKRSDQPGGLWLLAEGGLGKTFLLNSIFRRHPPIDTQDARICPLLSLSFTSKPSKSDIFLSFLMQLGQDPDLISYSGVDALEQIVIDAFQQCKTVAILFDEAQHLWLKTTGRYVVDRRGGVIGDTLKRLYDQTGIAFIFSGTPGLDELLKADRQASSRWAGKHILRPFEFDKNFNGLIDALDCALPMPKKADLMLNFARPLFDASQGNFRILKNIIAEAVYLAACENAPALERKHLSRAFFLITCAQNNPFENQ